MKGAFNPNPLVTIEGDNFSPHPLTWEQIDLLGLPRDADTVRGDLKTVGMFQFPHSYRAQCMRIVWEGDLPGRRKIIKTEFFGLRTMRKLRDLAHELEGKVGVGGRDVRAFTSHTILQYPDGRLVEVATIFACFDDAPAD